MLAADAWQGGVHGAYLCANDHVGFACSVLAEGAKARVEPEIAFVLGRDLKPRAQPYSDADVRASRGEGLEAGQIVTLGSYAGVLELPLATPLDIRFGDLGTLSVQFIGMV